MGNFRDRWLRPYKDFGIALVMTTLVIIVIFLLLWVGNVFADKLMIPFECYPKHIQTEFAKEGLKLDLDSVSRTEDSWGYLVNEGTRFIIYTYHPVTNNELQLVMDIIQRQWRKLQYQQ